MKKTHDALDSIFTVLLNSNINDDDYDKHELEYDIHYIWYDIYQIWLEVLSNL